MPIELEKSLIDMATEMTIKQWITEKDLSVTLSVTLLVSSKLATSD